MTFPLGSRSAKNQAKAVAEYQHRRDNPLPLSQHRHLRATAHQPQPVEMNEYVPTLGPLPMPNATGQFTTWLLSNSRQRSPALSGYSADREDSSSQTPSSTTE